MDREEDERHGRDRGDEPPAGLRSREQRHQALAAAKARLQAEREQQLETGEATGSSPGSSWIWNSLSAGVKPAEP
ncbi:MAG: hypothetical protein ACJ780_09235 [Solirubrobacteraceae bacterium]